MNYGLSDNLDMSCKEHGCYVGGSPYIVKTRMKRDCIVSLNPTTGGELGSVVKTLPQEYEYVVHEAQKAFLAWRKVPAPKRGELIGHIGRELTVHKNRLATLISLEMGKIYNESLGEVQEFIDMCAFAEGLSRKLGGAAMSSERPNHRMFEQWHPLGIVGIFSAFNFPVAVLGWNRCISAVCGNVDIWKPSSLTPFTSLAVQKICARVAAEHGHPNIFNMVIGDGNAVGKLLLEDKRIPLISFTGSTETGRMVAKTVAERFGKTILELGGNNAVIVAPDANLDMATRAIVFGALGTAGQRCTTTRRVIAHESVAAELLKRIEHAYRQVNIGDPLEKETHVGPLVSQEAVRAGLDAAYKASTQGGVPILACKAPKPTSLFCFMSPHIMLMPSQMPIVKEETFAPILYVMTYKDLDEAIAMQNDVPQGLSSAIFTEGLKTAEKFLSAVGSDCGIANVNTAPSGAEIGGAFGGEKETGGGREAGSDSWKQYMRRQTNTVNWGDTLPLAQGIEFDINQ